jgi:hypothetical protein
MPEEPDEYVPDGAALMPEIPAELGVHPLLLAVLHAVIFLEGSDDTIVNADAAAEALEYMAGYLQRMDGPELRRMQEDLLTLAAFAKDQDWGKQPVKFFKEFLENLGIGTAEEEG